MCVCVCVDFGDLCWALFWSSLGRRKLDRAYSSLFGPKDARLLGEMIRSLRSLVLDT